MLLSVADQGPGLPEEARDRVFTPFYRLDDSAHGNPAAWGLGLAMVKSLVEYERGHGVLPEPRPPAGLKVTIRLRAADY